VLLVATADTLAAVFVLVGLAWTAIAAMVVLLATQLLRWSGSRCVVALQAATPYVLALSVPIAAVAIIAARWALAVVAVAMVVVLLALCGPSRFPPRQPPAPTGVRPLRVFHGNLLYYNGRTAEMARAVAALDADVLAFTEYTSAHSGGLYVAPLIEAFPYRIEHPEPRAGGSALWSRFPLTEIHAPPALYSSTAAVVSAPDLVTVYVAHPPNPLNQLHHWLDELAQLAALKARAEPPAMVVGDFNATPWHPPFRRLLAAGWRNAHQLAGHGFSCSWPTDKRWLRPFLRLDHALVDNSLVVTDVADVELPGSDHRGLVVSVVVTRSEPATPAAHAR
jgi:endonuclease/exonuclease/phosphatase (EEP) superfamily protein YafD